MHCARSFPSSSAACRRCGPTPILWPRWVGTPWKPSSGTSNTRRASRRSEGEHVEVVVRKTYKYRLNPTPEQEQALEVVLHRCRTLYNVALEQRKAWWGRGQGIGASYYQQKRELPDLKAACPAYAEVPAHVLQD